MKSIPPVKITLGNERTIVVEKKDYGNSIFEEQYRHALHEVVNYLKNDFCDISQIIAFCGDRGEGKTSSMLSFAELLRNFEDNSAYIKQVLTDESDYTLLRDKKILVLPLLDPSYFEKEYSVLEYLTGIIYNYISANAIEKNSKEYREALGALLNVKRSLFNLHKRIEDRFDPMDEIGALALGLNLKESLDILVKKVLSLFGKTHIVMLLDDIDLNMEGAYMMVEQIRKYLSAPEFLIFTSVNLHQLQTAISVSIQRDSLINTSYNSEKIAEDMARKYIDKLIPASARVHMPKTDLLSSRPLLIEDNNGKEIYSNPFVKDGVVELIFQKTRYLFFNSKGGVSKIIPDNLRELMHLVGLLADMPAIGEQRENLRANQREFKNYFFKIWTQKLPSDLLSELSEWINAPSDNSLNKSIIDFFSAYPLFENYFDRDFTENKDEKLRTEEENKTVQKTGYATGSFNHSGMPTPINPDKHLDSILYSNNFSYNISVGDVFYVINCLEKDYLSEDADRILFFIKSLYSMRLYEDYDAISETEGATYPTDDNVRGIYRSDDRFLHTNILQRLVNGAYFTYSPGELIAYNSASDSPIDQRTILGLRYNKPDNQPIGINRLIHEIKSKWSLYDHMNDEEKESFLINLKMVEFFFLTISNSISARTKKNLEKASYIEKYMCQSRTNVTPKAFSAFNAYTGYYIFDVLAPFANLINPEYCYKRFNSGDIIFQISCSLKDSLLYSLIKQARVGRGEAEDKVDADISKKIDSIKYQNVDPKTIFYSLYHPLQSDATIRNAEILAAFFEDCKAGRNKRSKSQSAASSGYAKILSDFYKDLIYPDDRAMSTHKRSEDKEGEPHKIRFGFLKAFVDLLDLANSRKIKLTDTKQPTQNKSAEKIFNEIFNPSFGLSTIVAKLRLNYILSLQKDRSKRYTAKGITKDVVKKHPALEPVLQEFVNHENPKTSRTLIDWYNYLWKNYKIIESALDNQAFDTINSELGMELVDQAIIQALTLPEEESDSEDIKDPAINLDETSEKPQATTEKNLKATEV